VGRYGVTVQRLRNGLERSTKKWSNHYWLKKVENGKIAKKTENKQKTHKNQLL